MNFNELKPADILLFSGAKDWMSQAIMLLTNSEVTHAALSYKHYHQIIEQTPPSIRIFEVDMTGESSERLRGRKIYVNRLNSYQTSMTPVINAATLYLNNETPYAKTNLYLLGLILIYKKWSPNILVKQVIIKILKKLTAQIIEYINKQKSPGKLPMVCSQFVYQCYEDAGEDYNLILRKDSLLSRVFSVARDNFSLLDRVTAQLQNAPSPQFQRLTESQTNLAPENVPLQTEEELAHELIDAMQSDDIQTSQALESELALAVCEFGQAVYLAEGSEDNAKPMMIAETNQLANELQIPPLLSFLKAKEAYFVTPEDLLNHCENVTQVGIIEL